MTSSETIAVFGRAYTKRMPQDEAPTISAEQLEAEIACAFRFLDDRGADRIAVRVFRPSVDLCGYEAPGSVIEIATDDMPFLVDSATNCITRSGYTIVRHFHPVFGTVRDESARITAVVSGRESAERESLQHFEITETLDEDDSRELEAKLGAVLEDVHAAVADFERLRFAVRRMAHYAYEDREAFDAADVEEAGAFLEWLLDDNFVLLGYREYDIEDQGEGPAITAKPESGLGIMAEARGSRFAEPVLLSSLEPGLRERYETSRQLVISKTNRRSTVHRDVRLDYIGLRRVHSDGSPKGEVRLVGLFTSKAYMEGTTTIPILRNKLDRILKAEDVLEGSHDYKVLTQIFESFPKDELFGITDDDLRASLLGLLEAEEHQHVRLFVRPDVLQRNISVLVVVPRGRFNTDLRQNLQDLFQDRYGGTSVDYQLTLGETGDARIHFTVWVDGPIPDVSIDALERDVYALTRTWEDRVCDIIAEERGRAAARSLVEAHSHRFPEYFRASTTLTHAAVSMADVDALLATDDPIRVSIHNDQHSDEELTRIVVYSRQGKRDLSEMLPLVEDLGLRAVEEIPTKLSSPDADDDLYAHDFGVLGPDGGSLDVDECGERVGAALTATLRGETESDGLSRLLVLTDIDHHQVNILRAYRSYWHLVNPAFSKTYVADAFAAHPAFARDLIRLFELRFGPDADADAEHALETSLFERLEGVESLDEDRIIRGFVGLIKATVRTSAFLDTPSIAFKLLSEKVPAVPEPKPMYEIFVFAPDAAGIHLRGGAVARGGIRWSNRRADYRTEVLGLMKAQMTKNVVIVPTGAKGGFVIRHATDPIAGPTFDEVRAGYRTFVRALLDITDTLENGSVVHPDGVRVLDGEDPYFVVAADRGTATFSDTANAIAAQEGFWLDDAFASGGSTGYDHKELGITARGAWESVRRHFMELDVDVQTDPITVAGIGDMSGDVFGNGMLLSKSIKLVAAFDHRHIFVDPDPDPAVSYAERQRLAGLNRSSWNDYDRTAMSTGGGIFARSLKRIDLTDEMRSVLGTGAREMTPAQLISAILRAPVDLLWNGGIGTYVKASTETNDDAQDRANDSVRVNGRDLRCKVVGEGGNLGLTQAGRIEFDNRGGRIFTDFVDNAGGVHCSDREVNIKILLSMAERKGLLSRDERNALIADVSDDVVAAIVYDNFLQAQILSQEVAASAGHIEAYDDLMTHLESTAGLDRTIEMLPTSEEMAERVRDHSGMHRPELAVLLAHAKSHLTDALVESDLPDDEFFESTVTEYFPPEVAERFGDLIPNHPLRRELVSTIVANEVLNSQGVTFASRLEVETGAGPAEIVRAYRVARRVVGASTRWRDVEALAGSIEAELVNELLNGVDDLVETTTRWFITRGPAGTVTERAETYLPGFSELAGVIRDLGSKRWRAQMERRVNKLVGRGVPEAVAARHVYQVELVHAPDIIDVAEHTGLPLREVGNAFYLAGQEFHIDWLERRVEDLPTANRWQRWAGLTLDRELMDLRRSIVERILSTGEGDDAKARFDEFNAATGVEQRRLARLVDMLKKDGVSDSASVFVTIRQLQRLASQ